MLNFDGKRFSFSDVPMEIAPLQKPHPPIWYGVHSPDSAERAARRGLNTVSLDPPAETRACERALPRDLERRAPRRCAAQARPRPLHRGGAERRRGDEPGASRLSALARQLHLSVPAAWKIADASATLRLRHAGGARPGHCRLARDGDGVSRRASLPKPAAITWSGNSPSATSRSTRRCARSTLFAREVMPALRRERRAARRLRRRNNNLRL